MLTARVSKQIQSNHPELMCGELAPYLLARDLRPCPLPSGRTYSKYSSDYVVFKPFLSLMLLEKSSKNVWGAWVFSSYKNYTLYAMSTDISENKYNNMVNYI